MLRHLRVTNFALLSDVAVELEPGFNVLTGETGAGKSLIVEAVNLLRGGRASADIPREGASQAVVEAIFDVPADLSLRVRTTLVDAGLPDGDDEVLVRRVIQKGGRSRTYVNGALTTAKRLADLGALLVDLSGQHQHQGLVDPRRHREILDAFGDHGDALARMAACHERLLTVEAELSRLGGDERARQERVDYLRYQLEEIDQAQLQDDEDAALEDERARLSSIDQLHGGVRSGESLLYGGDDAAVDKLSAAARELARLVHIDRNLAEPLRQIEEAQVLAEEAAATLRDYADHLDGDPHRLEAVDDRLALLSRLKRKHQGTLADVIARGAALADELSALENRDERVAELEAERRAAHDAAREAARALTELRAKAGDSLMARVGAALDDLGMAAARLSVHIEPADITAHGADKVEYLLASNVGEGAKPLAKIASGGELSRITLALKLTLRRADEVATYVFDEVDAGIGGVTAEVVGRQIRAVADQRQVLCVTHLPQIAAFADTHFHVAKHTDGDRTETAVNRLDGEARRDEMARMLGGARLTKRARAHAAEMLREAAATAAH